MTRSIYTKEYDRFRELLVEAREAAGLTQYDIAERLKRPQSYVSKYERGERRLDVIEFLEVAEALDVHPFDLLTGLESVVGDENDIPVGNNILDKWGINPDELTTLVAENPSLRGMLFGYVAELKYREMWLNHGGITSSFKHDDHNRNGKGDRVVTFQGQEFIVEVKSLQTNTIVKRGDTWQAQAQVDASDRRTVVLPDGSEVLTTCLLKGEFDILAVNIFAFEDEWRFVFAKNSSLPTTNSKKYDAYQKQHLLATSVTVTWPPQPPFTADPYQLLEELYQERAMRATTSSSPPPSPQEPLYRQESTNDFSGHEPDV